MTPHDHNKTVGIAHGLVGTLILTGLIIAAVLEAHRHPSDPAERLAWMLYVLPLPLLQLITAYGVYTIKRWGRTLALVFSVLYVFVFPPGTLLVAYTWWVLYGETGRRLYDQSPSAELNE